MARFDDLWGDPEHVQGFAHETQLALIVGGAMCALAYFCWELGGWRRWVSLLALALVPVFYLVAPVMLALYVFGPAAGWLLWAILSPFVRRKDSRRET